MNLPSYQLLDEAWIPVRYRDGRIRNVGLRQVFDDARQIIALADTSPPNLVAMHRLLLAILHRALRARGTWSDADRAVWRRGGWPPEALHGYFDRWRERFWLFHPTHPFMQVAALAEADETRDRKKPWSQVALDRVSGNAPVVFDHTLDDAPVAREAGQLLRDLLGFLQFTPGGLVKVFRSADKAGALANTAAVLPQGESLAATLLLNLHPFAPAWDDDLPTWERPAVGAESLRADPLPATGPCDRYTRLSRSVLLLPEAEQPHEVRWIRFGAGQALADDELSPDPMSAFRTGSNGLVRFTFAEGKETWRDLASLLPEPTGTLSQPAAVMSWAVNLLTASGEMDGHLSVMVCGLASDQAKLERWRCDLFSLPAATVLRADVAQEVRRLLALAEKLHTEALGVAADLLMGAMPALDRKQQKAAARQGLRAAGYTATFFSATERSFPRLLSLLGEGDLPGAGAIWQQAMLAGESAAWSTAERLAGTSMAALRSGALVHVRRRELLKPLRDALTSLNPKEHSA